MPRRRARGTRRCLPLGKLLVEEFLPLHVAVVLRRQRWEAALHEARKVGPRPQSQIFPEVIAAHAGGGNDGRHVRDHLRSACLVVAGVAQHQGDQILALGQTCRIDARRVGGPGQAGKTPRQQCDEAWLTQPQIAGQDTQPDYPTGQHAREQVVVRVACLGVRHDMAMNRRTRLGRLALGGQHGSALSTRPGCPRHGSASGRTSARRWESRPRPSCRSQPG